CTSLCSLFAYTTLFRSPKWFEWNDSVAPTESPWHPDNRVQSPQCCEYRRLGRHRSTGQNRPPRSVDHLRWPRLPVRQEHRREAAPSDIARGWYPDTRQPEQIGSDDDSCRESQGRHQTYGLRCPTGRRSP